MSCGGLPALYDFDPYAGDSWAKTFRLMRGGAPLDLSSATVTAWARYVDGFQVDLVVTVNAPAGEVTLQPPSGGLDPGRWAYDLEVNEAGAVTTWVRGTLRIRQDVTHAA